MLKRAVEIGSHVFGQGQSSTNCQRNSMIGRRTQTLACDDGFVQPLVGWNVEETKVGETRMGKTSVWKTWFELERGVDWSEGVGLLE